MIRFQVQRSAGKWSESLSFENVLCACYEKSWRKITNRPLSKDRGQEVLSTLNSVPTRLCHVVYYHGDKKYPYLVGIVLNSSGLSWSELTWAWNADFSRKTCWPLMFTHPPVESIDPWSWHIFSLKKIRENPAWPQKIHAMINRKENHRHNKKSTRPFSINT